MRYKIRRIFDCIKYDIPRGVENLIYWLPVIWKIRWWDGSCILDIVEHQVKQMEENWIVNTCNEADEEYKQNMQKVLNAIERLNEDQFYFNVGELGEGFEHVREDIDVVFDGLKDFRKWWD